MSTLEPITFEEALTVTHSQRREVLFGNGFAIAASSRFQYRSLFEAALLPKHLHEVFSRYETTDFEEILRRLDHELTTASPLSAQRLTEDRSVVRNALVVAVAAVHPPHRPFMHEDRYAACRRFLAHFIGSSRPGGRVFTTNYDLLIYWSLIPEFDEWPRSRKLVCEDGFMSGLYDPAKATSVSYWGLHGSLGFFNTKRGISKVRSHPHASMISQIQTSLELGEYPLFVSEGTSEQKLSRIRASPYLMDARKRLSNAVGRASSAFFILGHSLSENDAHILEMIGQGQNSRVFVGVHDSRDSQAWQRAEDCAARWAVVRRKLRPDSVFQFFGFDSRPLSIWR